MKIDPKIMIGTELVPGTGDLRAFPPAVRWRGDEVYMSPWSCAPLAFEKMFMTSLRRRLLVANLLQWLKDCGEAGIKFSSLILSGSFVSEKEDPADLDLFAFLNSLVGMAGDPLLSRRGLQDDYDLDVALSIEPSSDGWVAGHLKFHAWMMFHCSSDVRAPAKGALILDTTQLLEFCFEF